VALLSQKIPTVYQVGEHQEHYNKLVATYETQLLTVCENDMESAFDKWTDLMIDLEVYAKQEGVDIRGVKLWINVFFNEKGRIDYIAYHPKPISLNMDYNKLTKILMKFISFKGIDIKYNSGFSHYGSAHFPVLYQLYHQNEK
jgi:hypothetical protein